MRTDKIRKYVLPNIPYLFIGWACLKMGTAYRLAAGANFGEKLLGLMQAIGVAFADFSPGLDPFDWLIGIVGAVAFRLLIYFKSKNAKKYRRDEEYGSSRWGCPKDIQPFVDSKFENNVILTDRWGNETTVPADSVVIAAGFTRQNELSDKLEENTDMQVFNVGDSKRVRQIYDAIHEGFIAARQI